MGEIAALLKGVAEQVLTLIVPVEFQFRINGHDVFDKVQITEGDAGFQRVDADAAVSPKHIVHMQLPDTLLGFRLESFSGGREIGVLVAEQLIGNLAGQQDADIRVLVDVLADQIHTNAGTDGCDIERP